MQLFASRRDLESGTMRSLVVDVLLMCAALSRAGQTNHEPYTFFKQSIGLSDDQIADIQRGKAVTKALSTKTPAEVAVFGAVYIHASIEDHLKDAQNVNSLRGSPNYLGIQVFSTPPKLSDFQGFILEEQDIKDLKDCQPGKCELQLPAGSMKEFKKQVNWSAPDVAAQVNSSAQKMALEALVRYQKQGNSALGSSYDKEHPVHVIEPFEALLRGAPSLSHYLPDLQQYLLDYPRTQLPNAESSFFWERVKFGLKPTLRLNQMVIYRESGPSPPIDSVAINQLYASHYFQTALDLSVCATDKSRPDDKGFYLITVKRSRQAGLTGPKGSIVRKKAISKISSSLETSLTHIKGVLENKE
jgi:predicted RNase H-like nuclease